MTVEKVGNSWKAKIHFVGKDYVIGTFSSKKEAQNKYKEIKAMANKIKQEERLKDILNYHNNDFIVDAYERGQEIKAVCTACCHGNTQDVYECHNVTCEYFALKPVRIEDKNG